MFDRARGLMHHGAKTCVWRMIHAHTHAWLDHTPKQTHLGNKSSIRTQTVAYHLFFTHTVRNAEQVQVIIGNAPTVLCRNIHNLTDVVHTSKLYSTHATWARTFSNNSEGPLCCIFHVSSSTMSRHRARSFLSITVSTIMW